jgi:hypothetical protein
MLESVRSILSGKTLFILVTLLAIPFVFFGSTSFGTVFTSFGTVNGEPVTQTDVNLAASNITQRYQSIFGEDFSIDSIGEEQYSESLRQEIVNQKILLLLQEMQACLFLISKQKKRLLKLKIFSPRMASLMRVSFKASFEPMALLPMITSTSFSKR